MKKYVYKKIKRLALGSAITEFPPALLFLFVCAVFPVLNFMFIGLTYTSCALLNGLELREAAKTPHSQLPAILNTLSQNWQSTGIGRLAGVTTAPTTDVSYNKIDSDTYVILSNTFTVNSFVNIPFFKGIPGLGAPITYTIIGKRVLEEPDYATF